MKPPSKRFLEQCALLRYNLAATCAAMKAENYDAVDLDGLLHRVMEDADAILGIGEIPGWEELRQIFLGTLKICTNFLEADA